MLARLAAALPAMQARADVLDLQEAFPAEDMAIVRDLGLLTAPLPRSLGGQGLGTEQAGAAMLFAVLRMLGQGNLAVGRLYEAHVNALALIAAFATAAQQDRAGDDVRAGHLFGLWVTDPPGAGLTCHGDRLVGRKGPCSGAGHVGRAVVTIGTSRGACLAILPVDTGVSITPMRGVLQGMRASANGVASFDGQTLPPDALIGAPGDYLREPLLSTGAWRTSAVTLGGLDALTAATGSQLTRKGHQDAPLQQDRFGRMLIAQETAHLWVWSAAQRTEAQEGSVADRVAYVNLARIATEAACLDAIQLAQRALGLGAFIRPNPVERLSRDLAVYLRQPAPDAVLTEAARHALVP